MNNAWKLFKEALDILKKDWKYLLKTYVIVTTAPLLLVGALAILYAISYSIQAVSGTTGPSFINIIFGVLGTVAFLVAIAWTVPLLLLAIKSVLDGKYPTIRQLFSQGKKFVIPMLWTGLLSGLFVSLGFLLLVIPGIIFSIWVAFSQYEVIEHGLSGVAALKASRNLVKGRFWQAVGYGFFLALIPLGVAIIVNTFDALLAKAGLGALSIVTGLASMAVSIVVNAAGPIYMYLVYRHFKSSKS